MTTGSTREGNGASRPPPDEVFEFGDILVVDDHPGNVRAIEAVLGPIARRVVRAHSGEQALRKLLSEDFALILLDVQMPGMSGLETATLIRSRERSRSTPIIFVTAFERDENEVLEAYSLGAVDFLFKPIAPEVLRAKVSVFVDLQRRTYEVARHAELLREHQRQAYEKTLVEQKQRWEQDTLRWQMEKERRASAEIERKAAELARTVAELERVERELTRSNERLAAIDRRKNEFLAVLGHELRNPLAPLVNGLELLRIQMEAEPDFGEAIRGIHALMERQVGHVRRLVDDLLDVSRISRGRIELRRERVDLADVVEQAVDMSQPLLSQHGHRLAVKVADTPLLVHGDLVRLIQILANLLSNAARYTQRGGVVELTCEPGSEAGHAVLRVRDNGRGIQPDMLPRVFDLFTQERRGGEGMGVGLTLVKHLVELHGGRVEAHSEGEGRGATFTVQLPLRKGAARDEPARRADAGGPKPESPAASPTPERCLHILVADDQVDVRESLRELLVRWGHRVELAADGEEAVSLMQQSLPDVALVDLGMPRLDGFGVATRVRQMAPGSNVRLIAMTGFGQRHDRALESGFDLHLVKPVTPITLRQALRTASA